MKQLAPVMVKEFFKSAMAVSTDYKNGGVVKKILEENNVTADIDENLIGFFVAIKMKGITKMAVDFEKSRIIVWHKFKKYCIPFADVPSILTDSQNSHTV